MKGFFNAIKLFFFTSLVTSLLIFGWAGCAFGNAFSLKIRSLPPIYSELLDFYSNWGEEWVYKGENCKFFVFGVFGLGHQGNQML